MTIGPIQTKSFPLGAGNTVHLGRARPGGGGAIGTPHAGGVRGSGLGEGDGGIGQFVRNGSAGSFDFNSIVAGQVKSIHANDLASHYPGDNWYTQGAGINGNWVNWCGGVFSPDYSAKGAMIYWGGGHLGYSGVEFYIFDLTTQQWSRLNGAIPYDWLYQTAAQWCDADFAGYPIMPPQHTYSNTIYIPPSLGGGPKGSWACVYQVYGGGPTEGAGTSGFKGHKVDLATGAWSRLTAVPGDSSWGDSYVYGAYNGSFIDTKRGVIWVEVGNEAYVVAKLDLTAPIPAYARVNGVSSGTGYGVPAHSPELDMVVWATCYQNGAKQLSLTAQDLSTGTAVNVDITRSGSFTLDVGQAGGGFEWCPDTGKFYFWEGFATQKIYVVTPPAGNWKTGAWTMSVEIPTGELFANVQEVLPNGQGCHPLSKWRYNRTIKAFMWSGGTCTRNSPDGVARNGAFQIYRPLGITG